MNNPNEIEQISIAVRAICNIHCCMLLENGSIPQKDKGIAQLHFLSLSNNLISKLSRKRNATYILKTVNFELKINIGKGSDKIFIIELQNKTYKCSL